MFQESSRSCSFSQPTWYSVYHQSRACHTCFVSWLAEFNWSNSIDEVLSRTSLILKSHHDLHSLCSFSFQLKWKCKKDDETNGGYSEDLLFRLLQKVYIQILQQVESQCYPSNHLHSRTSSLECLLIWVILQLFFHLSSHRDMTVNQPECFT